MPSFLWTIMHHSQVKYSREVTKAIENGSATAEICMLGSGPLWVWKRRLTEGMIHCDKPTDAKVLHQFCQWTTPDRMSLVYDWTAMLHTFCLNHVFHRDWTLSHWDVNRTCSTFNSQMFLDTSSQAYWAKFSLVQFILSIYSFRFIKHPPIQVQQIPFRETDFFVWFLLLQLDPVVRWSQMSKNSRNNCFSFQIAQASLSLVSFIPFFLKLNIFQEQL